MGLEKFKSKLHLKINQGADHNSDPEQHGLIIDYGFTPSTSSTASPSAATTAIPASDPASQSAPKPKKRMFQLKEPGTNNLEACKAIIEREKGAPPNTGPLTESEVQLEEELRVPDALRQGTPEQRRKAIRETLRLQQAKDAGRMAFGGL